MNQFPNKNYFTMPNEIFSLGLDTPLRRSTTKSPI